MQLYIFFYSTRKMMESWKKAVWLMQLHILKFLQKQWNKFGIDTWKQLIVEVLVVMYLLKKETVEGKNDLLTN